MMGCDCARNASAVNCFFNSRTWARSARLSVGRLSMFFGEKSMAVIAKNGDGRILFINELNVGTSETDIIEAVDHRRFAFE